MVNTMEQLALLRATTQRLVNTPTEDLPKVAGFLATNLASCSAILNGETSKSDFAVPLHKLRTRISALLQDRTAAGRLTAAVLIKALAEAPRPTDSAIWEAWARGLIGCLNKADPWEVKKVYLAAAVRVLLSAQGNATLQREVTNPLLPSLLTASLSAIKPITTQRNKKPVTITSPLLPSVLRCWDELIQGHPATFRPFVARIKPICLSLVSDPSSAAELQQIATRLLSSLHLCAPKGSAATEWQLAMSNIVQAGHGTLDLVFRGVYEDWKANGMAQNRPGVRHIYSKEPEQAESDAAGLGPWKSVHQGSVRVASLLRWAIALLRCQISTVAVPLGLLLDLPARINAVTIPRTSDRPQNQFRLNLDVAKDEREALWADLPMLHTNSLDLLSELVEVLGQAATPLVLPISDQVFDLFDAEAWHEGVRCQCYATLSSILRTNCCMSLRLDRRSLEAVCRFTCEDLKNSLPQSSEQRLGGEPTHSSHGRSSVLLATTQTSHKAVSIIPDTSALFRSAWQLLPLLLDALPSASLSHATRTEIDRISILSSHGKAMFASVMNPATGKSGQRMLPSILPFFARSSHDASTNLEAIMRPRIPLVSEVFVPATESSASLTHHEEMAVDEDSLIEDLSPPDNDHNVETPVPIEMEAQAISHDRGQPSEQLGRGKRDFAVMNQSVDSSLSPKVYHLEQNETAKRTHTEDVNGMLHTISTEEQRISANALNGKQDNAADGKGPMPVQVQLPGPAKAELVSHGKSVIASAQENSDSDSDIPAIDATLATDDEEEEEEEEDE
jgi:pre-rRNA-processing protein RIX1